jgi:uncharacterized protein (DUF1697 family)
VARNVIFLRGINVGRNGRFAMADFKRLLESTGATDVKTYLNSGNAVFTSAKAPASTKRALEQAIANEFGTPIPCIVRTAAALNEVVDGDPFAGVANDGSKYVVVFLSGDPDPEAMKDLAAHAADYAPEQFVHRGQHVYVWCPDGLRDAKLPLVLSKKRIGVAATARNWNTVTKMLALTGETPQSSAKRG